MTQDQPTDGLKIRPIDNAVRRICYGFTRLRLSQRFFEPWQAVRMVADVTRPPTSCDFLVGSIIAKYVNICFF